MFRSTILKYQAAKKNNTWQFILLKQKENVATLNTKIIKSLAVWQQKHPHFYQAVKSNQNTDQLMQLITNAAQQAGFAINQVAPQINKKKMDQIIQLQLSGNYIDLFSFIQKINNEALPVTLTKLKIPRAGIFNITLTLPHELQKLIRQGERTTENIVIPTRDPFVNSSVLITQSVTQNILPSLHSHWFPLYFAKAKNVADFISKKSSGILSQQGKINFDARSNQIWLKDDKQHVKQISALIHHLDAPSAQFLIKAKIINLDRQYQKSLGLIFRTDDVTQSSPSSLSMNQPDANTNDGDFTITVAKLAANHLLNLQLSALEQEGHAKLISNPELTTLENQPAIIESGAEVPYQHATSSGATSVSFKKAVLRLQVTPQHMPNNHILLHIALNQDKVSDLTINGEPAIQTQQITTQVVVKNNQTIVLGGIFETSREKQQQGIPIADHIPILGVIFQHHENITKQQELLIFITPIMMKSLS
ncbi:MAG TPA: secretin N-terminal domain-containing protein [Coxiellaceae bacterium]|nr:secretin N-terminal domain-containing protein [Coxiellaceae bacterium]